jgi:dGTPase
MNIRQTIEQNEKKILSKYAKLASQSEGRVKPEPECSLRTIFMRDRDRIIHSEAFRRMKHKTQVFFSPANDLFRTRLTHTLEVSQISRTVAKSLRLNEDLTEAISLAHDLGHTPFGHTGEKALDEISENGFNHAEQSFKIIDFLEKGGLNLSIEVRNGILKHSKRGGPIHAKNEKDLPMTLEGEIVRICDRIAYLNHDLDDAVRADILRFHEIPDNIIENFGNTHGMRINTMVSNIIENSKDKPGIQMSADIAEKLDNFKDFMYTKVYNHPAIKNEADKTKKVITDLYNFFIKNPEIVLKKMQDVPYPENTKEKTIILDYIAMMTDDFALRSYEKYIFPKRWFTFERDNSKPAEY